MAKRNLKMEDGNAKSIPRKETPRTPNTKGVSSDFNEDSDENTSCGFCGLKYFSVHSVQKDDWIRRQKCDTCYREVCVRVVAESSSYVGNACDSAA
jgi:hypothetical protein